MAQKEKADAPLQIRNLAELKRCIQPGTKIKVLSHSKHPDLIGLVRVVTEVQTNAYYSVVKDQPEHPYSTCNYGKGFRSDIEKAADYRFEGTTVTVLDSRKRDGSVLYEMEIYPARSLKKLRQRKWMRRKSHRKGWTWPYDTLFYAGHTAAPDGAADDDPAPFQTPRTWTVYFKTSTPVYGYRLPMVYRV